MKRILSGLMVLFVLLSLCACGGNADSGKETEPQPSALPSNIMQKEDPKGDDSMNVLFISNSTCYYFRDELYGLLTAAGYENVTLALTYYSGCSVKQHHDWWKSGEANYQFRVYDKNGEHSYEGYSLEAALRFRNWDVISFDNNARSFASGEVAVSLANAEPYFGELYGDIQKQFPLSRFFWHEVWANEIGYSLAFKMETIEQRTRVYEAKKGVAKIMADTYGLEIVPTGDAWEKVRDNELITTPVAGIPLDRFTLCTRVLNKQLKDDFSHDGDMGGGQYLNACVWFEVITGQSCVGNTFRPKYEYAGIDCSLSEEKIALLQNAAHEAVAELKK